MDIVGIAHTTTAVKQDVRYLSGYIIHLCLTVKRLSGPQRQTEQHNAAIIIIVICHSEIIYLIGELNFVINAHMMLILFFFVELSFKSC